MDHHQLMHRSKASQKLLLLGFGGRGPYQSAQLMKYLAGSWDHGGSSGR